MTCEAQKPIRIIRGEDRTIDLLIVDERGRPFDLTGYTTVSAKFKNQDDTLLTLSTGGSGVTVTSAILGKIQLALSDTQTLALKVKDFQDFEVEIVIGTSTKIVQFIGLLNVRRRVG